MLVRARQGEHISLRIVTEAQRRTVVVPYYAHPAEPREPHVVTVSPSRSTTHNVVRLIGPYNTPSRVSRGRPRWKKTHSPRMKCLVSLRPTGAGLVSRGKCSMDSLVKWALHR